MILKIDTTSSTPIYAQIITQVKHLIASGALQPGDALPSLRDMAARLRVNPLTVAKAYRELEVSGIVVTERGRGTFIAERSKGLSDEYKREALSVAVERMFDEAHQLGASPEEILEVVTHTVRGMHNPTTEGVRE